MRVTARPPFDGGPFIAYFTPSFRDFVMPLSYFLPGAYIVLFLSDSPFWSFLTFIVFLTLAMLNTPSTFTLVANSDEVLVRERKYFMVRGEYVLARNEIKGVAMHWQDASNPFRDDGELHGMGGRRGRTAGYRLLVVGANGVSIGAGDATRTESVVDALESCGRKLADFLDVGFEKVLFVPPQLKEEQENEEEEDEEVDEQGQPPDEGHEHADQMVNGVNGTSARRRTGSHSSSSSDEDGKLKTK